MRKIDYNSQRDNFDFDGKFPAWKQCFSTCAWMFMSYYNKDINATNDTKLAQYVDDVEALVGKPGIAEKVKQKYNWITGNTSMWWLVQQAGIQKNLSEKEIIFSEKISVKELPELVKEKPVIIGTHKMGGLPGGHIILLVDYDSEKDSYVVNDPYGNATGNYLCDDGDSILYSHDFLKKYIQYKTGCRCIFAIGDA